MKGLSLSLLNTRVNFTEMKTHFLFLELNLDHVIPQRIDCMNTHTWIHDFFVVAGITKETPVTNFHEQSTSLLIKWLTPVTSTKSFMWNPESDVKITSGWADSRSNHEMLKCLHGSPWNRPKEVQWCHQLDFYFKIMDSCHTVTPGNSMFYVISILYLKLRNTFLHFKW